MRRFGRITLRWTRRLALVLAIAAATLLIGRIIQSESGPPLEPWHTFIPNEPRAAEIDQLDWNGYIAAEARVFAAVRDNITNQLPRQDRTPDFSPAARFISAISPRTGTILTSSGRTVRREAPSFCSTD